MLKVFQRSADEHSSLPAGVFHVKQFAGGTYDSEPVRLNLPARIRIRTWPGPDTISSLPPLFHVKH